MYMHMSRIKLPVMKGTKIPFLDIYSRLGPGKAWQIEMNNYLITIEVACLVFVSPTLGETHVKGHRSHDAVCGEFEENI